MDKDSQIELAAVLGNLAVDMHAQADPEATLRTIVMSAVDMLPGISWAGVALVRGTEVIAQTPTDEVSRMLNELQNTLGEGPTITALRDEPTLAVSDLREETRWPRFVGAAIERGVLCLMSFRLFVRDEVLGALTIYGPVPGMFTAESVMTGEILAQHAAVALAGATAQDQLQRAVASRDLIGQAKGIMMHRDRVSAVAAFTALVKASQDTNIKLIDIARFVVTEFEKQL